MYVHSPAGRRHPGVSRFTRSLLSRRGASTSVRSLAVYLVGSTAPKSERLLSETEDALNVRRGELAPMAESVVSTATSCDSRSLKTPAQVNAPKAVEGRRHMVLSELRQVKSFAHFNDGEGKGARKI